MCGRFTLMVPPAVLHEWLQAVDGIDYPPRYNIAPTQPLIVIFNELDGKRQRRAILMRWGLVPLWVKDPREFPLIINARAETIMQKPSFRGSLRHHRCIIPASGYYEWRKGPDGKKQPCYITMQDGSPMAFAGVYSNWMGATGEEIDTAAIITVPANTKLKPVHARMPAIIPNELMDDWLDIRNISDKQAHRMLAPLPESAAVFHPVSTRVGGITNDDEGLIVPVSEDRPTPPKKTNEQMDLF